MFRKLILVLLLLPLAGWAQYNNNSWCFGDSVYIDWNNASNPVIGRSSIKFLHGSTSIGDSIGIIAYSSRNDFFAPVNGLVWNKYHQQMQNGNYIFGGGWYHERLFLPAPGSDSLLYLISCCVTSSCPFGLYYTLIDLSANSDSGAIIQKNVPINNYPAFDGLMAVQHGNGKDWWLLYQRWDGANGNIGYNDFFIYLVDSGGVHLNSQTNVGTNHKTGGGHLCFNKSGDKFSVVTWRNLIQLYNFNRCTGVISLWNTVQVENTPPIYSNNMSCAFSPDGSKLYVSEYSQTSTPSRLIQYDLNASNIAASATILYNFNDPDIGISDLKLAPDGKIYLSAMDESGSWIYTDTMFTYINQNLSVINQPDSLGLACDFQPFSFYLGGARTYYGLPNNPDYELGAWVGSPCDTLSVGVQHPEPTEKLEPFLQAWYNHEWDMIHVNASKLQGKKGVLRLVDIEGRVVFEKPSDIISGGYFTTEIYTNEISDGVYIVNLVTDKETLSFKVGKL